MTTTIILAYLAGMLTLPLYRFVRRLRYHLDLPTPLDMTTRERQQMLERSDR